MNPLKSPFLAKLGVCKDLLCEITAKVDYQAVAFVRKGQILEESFVGNSYSELRKMVKRFKPAITLAGDKIGIAEDILIRYSNGKIYLKKVTPTGDPDPLWLLVRMNDSALYFKRFLARIVKHLQFFLRIT